MHLLSAVLVHRLEGTRKQQHWDVRQIRSSFDEGGDVVAAPFRHPDIGKDDVRQLDWNARDGLLAVPDGYDLHVLARERELDDALNGHAVIGEQELMRHESLSSRTPTWRSVR
jgi:hypothetical protein